MGRPKSLNPARKLNVTIPEALLKTCKAAARLEKRLPGPDGQRLYDRPKVGSHVKVSAGERG